MAFRTRRALASVAIATSAAATALGGCAAEETGEGGCTTDTDCRGVSVCENGACMPPRFGVGGAGGGGGVGGSGGAGGGSGGTGTCAAIADPCAAPQECCDWSPAEVPPADCVGDSTGAFCLPTCFAHAECSTACCAGLMSVPYGVCVPPSLCAPG